MKPRTTLLALWAASQIVAHAQVGVGTTTPNASAQLDVTSTTLGFLPPRMTSAQREGIVSPAAGLLVYQTDGSPGLYGYDGSVWTTFSGKESALTFGTGFSRDGNTITTTPASGTASGALASADWTHFNTAYGWGNHASAGYLTSFTETDPLFTASAAHGIVGTDITAWNAKVPATLTLSTTAPLSGGGDLSANRTLAIAQASSTADGYLSSANWSTFNGKLGGVTADSPLASSGGTSPNLTILTASASQAGALSSADWSTFNGKESALSFSSPLSRSTNTISLPAATSSANGYLTSTNWTTFNAKIGGSGTTNYVPMFTAAGTVGNSALFSDANGNVGIGTITPTGKLEVIDNGASSGGNTARFYNPSLADAGVHYISIGKSSVNNECALMGFSKEATISRAWLGVTGDDIIGGIGLTVQKGGNVGIGDNSPAYRFSVFNNIYGDYAARIYNGNNSGSAHGLLIRAGSNGNPFGSVMIGFQNIDGSAIGSISQNAASTVSYSTSSDRRLKENITPTHFGLADLMKLQAVDYNFIADAAKTPQTGFIAQDLDAVFPDAVTEGGDDAKT
ncbi:MAG: tail fiber domain-containing protein, partial [Verrucomicrobiota bacterium]